jgi:acetyl esterase/lipase
MQIGFIWFATGCLPTGNDRPSLRSEKAPCFVHIHSGYWQRGSKEIFACLSEGPLARGWSAALCGYTLAPEATLTQITDELKSAPTRSSLTQLGHCE